MDAREIGEGEITLAPEVISVRTQIVGVKAFRLRGDDLAEVCRGSKPVAQHEAGITAREMGVDVVLIEFDGTRIIGKSALEVAAALVGGAARHVSVRVAGIALDGMVRPRQRIR